MTRWFPPIHRGVVVTIVALVVGIVTNAWHKNPVSGGVIAVTLIALAVWGGQMLTAESERDRK